MRTARRRRAERPLRVRSGRWPGVASHHAEAEEPVSVCLGGIPAMCCRKALAALFPLTAWRHVGRSHSDVHPGYANDGQASV